MLCQHQQRKHSQSRVLLAARISCDPENQKASQLEDKPLASGPQNTAALLLARPALVFMAALILVEELAALL